MPINTGKYVGIVSGSRSGVSTAPDAGGKVPFNVILVNGFPLLVNGSYLAVNSNGRD